MATFQFFTSSFTLTTLKHLKIRALNSDDNGGGGGGGGSDYSYLKMWKKAKEREHKELRFLNIARNDGGGKALEQSAEDLEKKNYEFEKILEVSKEERDRVQRMQVVDRAAAAIAAARALLRDNAFEKNTTMKTTTMKDVERRVGWESGFSSQIPDNEGTDKESFNSPSSRASGNSPPGPDFWSWTPPPEDDSNQNYVSNAKGALQTAGNLYPKADVMEKERSADILSIPFESKFSQNNTIQPLPPFQSLLEVHKVEDPNATQEASASKEEIGTQFSAHAAEAADALYNVDENPSYGVNPDGSRWWRETGVETRPDGVVCRWTLNRGVTADGVVEWEEKYWEAADDFKFKELGSEKSGRDAMGNVWHEYWKESMWQERGLLHMEKTADKWGKNGKGDEWREKWWEQYDASGRADKWAHKWCSIDPNTEVEVGHAHVWHERWGEKYDGQGGSIKYTDKWAERCEGDAWVKWGDKWDENFDPNSHGVKQGETWWQGKYGERWNRTWGEHHNGSGWVHKYGKSSSGEHWDTHVPEETWYERYPHFGFMHCFENSVQLREVTKPSQNL